MYGRWHIPLPYLAHVTCTKKKISPPPPTLKVVSLPLYIDDELCLASFPSKSMSRICLVEYRADIFTVIIHMGCYFLQFLWRVRNDGDVI